MYGARMVGKEGDNAGIESIKDRWSGWKLIKKVMSFMDSQILLQNAVPVDSIKMHVDEYEIHQIVFSMMKNR